VIYVTDTHPLIFLATDEKRRLGKRARRIFQELEKGQHSIIVPVVVLEEMLV
jgi:predicted nucleic acid-binding protein